MTTNEKVGLPFLQDMTYFGHIMPWIAADMCHVNMGIFHLKKQVLGILQTYGMVVDVTMYSTQRLECRQGVGSFDIANVACMPQFIDILEEVEELRDEGAMGVRQDTDSFHVYFRLTMKPMASTSLNWTLEPSIFTPASS